MSINIFLLLFSSSIFWHNPVISNILFKSFWANEISNSFFELLIFFDSEIICDNATEVFKSFESAKLNSSNSFLESSFFSLVIGIKFFASFILLRGFDILFIIFSS